MPQAPQLKDRSLKGQALAAGRFLRERLVAAPLQFARPYLKKAIVMRPLLFSFIAIGCVLIILGARQYYRTSPAASAPPAARVARVAELTAAVEATRPQSIAYKDLATKNPRNSTYVRLTDFDFNDHYTTRKGKGGGWEVAYVPAIQPREADSPAVRVPRVLVRTTEARNHKTLYDLSMKPLEGILVTGISSLPAEEQSMLRKSYGHLDLDKCWILQAGSVPPEAVAAQQRLASAQSQSNSSSSSGSDAALATPRSGLGMIGGGAGLAVIAAGFLLLAATKKS